MDAEKQQLREQLEKANSEIEKYKKIVAEYRVEISKVMSEYGSIKKETEETSRTVCEIKEEMEDIENMYNLIKTEYIALESEFVKIIEMSQVDTDACIKILRDYAKIMPVQVSKKEEKNFNKHMNLRVIKGGKID
ncbi:MAG: hypothetical protein A2Y24_01000 [Clostridiales bacterium GWE2_32_10]|nr:MAG: hypothetical protein A2Y24_01000 [Clostridiales bacterium GWE2_32_10]HBY19796.1 hypothetical protein [Clostridiales bacterium]